MVCQEINKLQKYEIPFSINIFFIQILVQSVKSAQTEDNKKVLCVISLFQWRCKRCKIDFCGTTSINADNNLPSIDIRFITSVLLWHVSIVLAKILIQLLIYTLTKFESQIKLSDEAL